MCVLLKRIVILCSFDGSLLMGSLFTKDPAEPTLEDTISLTILSSFFHLSIPITREYNFLDLIHLDSSTSLSVLILYM